MNGGYFSDEYYHSILYEKVRYLKEMLLAK